MASVRRQVIIERPPDAVWPRIGEATRIAEWFPGMVDATVDGDRRIITTATGLPLPETILCNDAITHRFQYRLDLPVVREHRGTIDVFDLGDGRSLVSYATDCVPDAMALVIGGATGNALQELKRQIEETQGSPDFAAGAPLESLAATDVNEGK